MALQQVYTNSLTSWLAKLVNSIGRAPTQAVFGLQSQLTLLLPNSLAGWGAFGKRQVW
jgi:hypothetical protein